MADANSYNTRRGDVEVALDEQCGKFVSEIFDTPDGGGIVLHGKDLTPFKFDPLDKALPQRVTQTETLIEPDSFTDYIIQFKTNTAICRASLGSNKITAVLDYHGRAREDVEDTSGAAKPGACSHVVTLLCPFDVDYARWRAAFGEEMNQVELAQFIEEMIHTISEPAAADIMEAVNDLKIDRSVRFKSARNDRNGTVQFTYEETEAERSDNSGQVALPQVIKIVLPIFQGDGLVQLEVKLRYRLRGGQVAFNLMVPGLDRIERDKFRSIGESVRDKTNTPVFYVQ